MAKLKGSLQLQAGDKGFDFSLPDSTYHQVFNLEQTVDNDGNFAGGMQFDPNNFTLNSLQDAQLIVVNNPSDQVIEVQLKLKYWTNGTPDDTDGSTYHYPSFSLRPKEFIVLPNPYIVSFDEATSASNAGAHSSIKAITGYSDSGVTLAEDIDGSEVELTLSSNGGYAFQVGDIIQLGQGATTANNYREVMEVVSIDGATQITVKRAQYGTSAGNSASTNWNAGHDNSSPIYFSYYNKSQNVGSMINGADAEIVATDEAGHFASSIIPLGGSAVAHRNLTNEADGLVRGSVGIQFYTQGGYQELGMAGDTASTEAGLTATTNYAFDIQVDGDTNFDNLTFTTSTNTKFGGSDGVIRKIQDALDVQYYTSGNLFRKGVDVSIVNGDIRFTSRTNWSTSAIALTAEDGADASFFGTGRIPAVGSIEAAVPASTPDAVVYKDGKTTPNVSSFAYDDGYGNISGVCTGTIDYSSSAITLRNAPPNAEFKVSFNYDSALSAGNNANDYHVLKAITVRSVNQHRNATAQIVAFN